MPACADDNLPRVPFHETSTAKYIGQSILSDDDTLAEAVLDNHTVAPTNLSGAAADALQEAAAAAAAANNDSHHQTTHVPLSQEASRDLGKSRVDNTLDEAEEDREILSIRHLEEAAPDGVHMDKTNE